MTFRKLLAAVKRQPGCLAAAEQKVRNSLICCRGRVEKMNQNYAKELRKLVK